MLRQLIKKQTKDIHKHVENLPVIKKILSCEISNENYSQYLTQLLYIYKELEEHKFFKKLNIDKLYNKCKMDIDQLNVPDLQILDITKIYCNYLKDIDNFDLFVSHCYVRYMADLMGGQIIKNKIQNKFPVNVYDIDKKNIPIIVNFVKNVNDDKLFCTGVHHSFSLYSSILLTLKS